MIHELSPLPAIQSVSGTNGKNEVLPLSQKYCTVSRKLKHHISKTNGRTGFRGVAVFDQTYIDAKFESRPVIRFWDMKRQSWVFLNFLETVQYFWDRGSKIYCLPVILIFLTGIFPFFHPIITIQTQKSNIDLQRLAISEKKIPGNSVISPFSHFAANKTNSYKSSTCV